MNLLILNEIPTLVYRCVCLFPNSGLFGTHFTLDSVSWLKEAVSLITMEIWGMKTSRSYLSKILPECHSCQCEMNHDIITTGDYGPETNSDCV